MPGKPETAPPPETVKTTAEQVAAYLEAHPAFLAERPELLATQTAPHRALGGVADFQAFLIERLRGDVRRLQDTESELIRQRRAVRSLTTQAHKAVLAMITAQDLETLVEVVTTDLAVLLSVDATVLAVETDDGCAHTGVAGVRCLPAGTIDAVLGEGCDILTVADGKGDSRVFGGAAGLVRSAVVVRLGGARRLPPAVLGIGARGAGRFQPGRNSDAFRFLAGVLEHCLRTRLGLPL